MGVCIRVHQYHRVGIGCLDREIAAFDQTDNIGPNQLTDPLSGKRLRRLEIRDPAMTLRVP